MVASWDACLKCTLCVTQCPVVSVNGDFAGPKALGPEWYRAWQGGRHEVSRHVQDCTFCQLCEAACPVGVPVAHLIMEHKARAASQVGRRERLRDAILARPHWVGRWSRVSRVPAVVRRFGRISIQVRLPKRRWSRVPDLGEPLASPRGTVGLFQDCYSQAYDPELIAMARALLRLWGYTVILVPQRLTCCGAAASAAGRPALAASLARRLRPELNEALSACEALVTLNATCDGTLRDEWPHYADLSLSRSVQPFDAIAAEAPAIFWERLESVGTGDGVWMTHTTCRGKVARGDGHLTALALRAGYQRVVPADAACCGAGGSYAFKAEHEATSEALVAALKRQVAEEGAVQGIMTDSGTCALHIEDATGVATRHPAYWLYQRYRQYLAKKETGDHERT